MIRPFAVGFCACAEPGPWQVSQTGMFAIGLVRRMQAQRMQRVREVLALELMARDAGVLADRLRVGRVGIRRDDRAFAKPGAASSCCTS